MILILHIFIAVAGLASSGYAYLSPSRYKIQVSWMLVLMTLLSGTVLVVTTHSSLMAACQSGLVYLGVTSIGIFFAQRKLASERS